MSMSTVTNNATSVADLIARHRSSMLAMAVAVQSGDLAGAQKSLARAQSYTASIDAASKGQTTSPYRNSLSTDLTSLTSTFHSGGPSEEMMSQQAIDALFSSDGSVAATARITSDMPDDSLALRYEAARM